MKLPYYPPIMENQMEKKWKMKWKLNLSELHGVRHPNIGGPFAQVLCKGILALNPGPSKKT